MSDKDKKIAFDNVQGLVKLLEPKTLEAVGASLVNIAQVFGMAIEYGRQLAFAEMGKSGTYAGVPVGSTSGSITDSDKPVETAEPEKKSKKSSGKKAKPEPEIEEEEGEDEEVEVKKPKKTSGKKSKPEPVEEDDDEEDDDLDDDESDDDDEDDLDDDESDDEDLDDDDAEEESEDDVEAKKALIKKNEAILRGYVRDHNPAAVKLLAEYDGAVKFTELSLDDLKEVVKKIKKRLEKIAAKKTDKE